jgi:hypothetical protein
MSFQPHQAGPITVARLRDWVREAKPGARLIYARGPSCRAEGGAQVANYVARLGAGGTDARGQPIEGLGLVTAHFTRGENREGQYLIQRTAKPLLKGLML